MVGLALAATACAGGSGSQNLSHPGGRVGAPPPSSCRSGFATPDPNAVGPSPAPMPSGLTLPAGFSGAIVANVPKARELAIAPNGDLFVGTEGSSVFIVAHADDAGAAATPQIFWTDPNGDGPNAGVALSLQECALYVGSNTAVWMVGYHPGDRSESRALHVASVRTGGIPAGSDGDVHRTTSVAFTQGALFVSIGSSCNACTEVDPTRAVVLQFAPTGGSYTTKAHRIRNAMALAVDPVSGHLWVAGAGQDGLPYAHPYEFADDLSAHPGNADYGWPDCEENHVAYVSGSNCAATVAPIVELPAYSTMIGATFYPADQTGTNAFPARFGGGLFLAAHGSWHTIPGSSSYSAPPQVVFVSMNGDTPSTPVNWSDPTMQWQTFLSGFQRDGSDRIGRPTGIVVGPTGSLFVADDQTGNIYRIRPTGP
ncbi:MAG: PQQ-dependent sugar dehydrogenase [Candidatus Tyrphobacter sp.]